MVDGKPNQWTFNGDAEKPTFAPSIRISRKLRGQNTRETICHSFVRDGKIQYLGDCKHELKGQTVELSDI